MINGLYSIDTGKQFLSQKMLDSTGDGGWTTPSGALPIVYYAGPLPGKIWEVYGVSILCRQGGTRTTVFTSFWQETVALTNGILFRKTTNGILDYYLAADPIKSSFEMCMVFPFSPGSMMNTSLWVSGDYEMVHYWDSDAAGFKPILDGDKNERFEWVVQDTFVNIQPMLNCVHYQVIK